MKIISWNVNGLRALHRNGHFGDVFEHSPDILCLQETKASPEQLPDDVANVADFHSYFSSSQVKKGYSGVATYSSREPKNISHGMNIKKFDEEGRMLRTDFDLPARLRTTRLTASPARAGGQAATGTAQTGDILLFNVYFPNGGQGPERLQYKLDFYDAFLEHIEKLRSSGHSIVFCGDINTAHEEIDLARPKENEDNTGFLPEERAWIDEVINLGYIDTFRHFYPNKKETYSYWDIKTRARDRNVGWRLDYVFVSPELVNRLRSAFILPNVYGSDHCPVGIELE